MQVRHAKSPLEFFSKIHSPSPLCSRIERGLHSAHEHGRRPDVAIDLRRQRRPGFGL